MKHGPDAVKVQLCHRRFARRRNSHQKNANVAIQEMIPGGQCSMTRTRSNPRHRVLFQCFSGEAASASSGRMVSRIFARSDCIPESMGVPWFISGRMIEIASRSVVAA